MNDGGKIWLVLLQGLKYQNGIFNFVWVSWKGFIKEVVFIQKGLVYIDINCCYFGRVKMSGIRFLKVLFLSVKK